MMAAAFTKVDELRIEEDEAKQLAAAIHRVTDLYDVPLMDEKQRAWINLMIVGAQVYGTRAATIIIKKKRQPQRPVQPIRSNAGVVGVM